MVAARTKWLTFSVIVHLVVMLTCTSADINQDISSVNKERNHLGWSFFVVAIEVCSLPRACRRESQKPA